MQGLKDMRKCVWLLEARTGTMNVPDTDVVNFLTPDMYARQFFPNSV